MKENNDILNQLKKGSKGAVPDGYFENLSGNVFNKINEQKPTKKESKTISMVWSFVAAAACILIFVGIQNSTESTDITKITPVESLAQINIENEEAIADFLEFDADLSDLEFDIEEI